MDTNRAIELLPWYLNGTLDDDEKRQVEEALATSDLGRDELEEVREAFRLYGFRLPAAALVDYAFDQPGAALPAALVERYLDLFPDAREELELVRESQRALEAEDVSDPPSGGEQPWRWLALAASLVAVASIVGWGWSWRQGVSLEQRLARMAAAVETGTASEQGQEEDLRREIGRLAAGKSDLVDQLAARDQRIAELGRELEQASQPRVDVSLLDLYPGEGLVLRGEGAEGPTATVPRGTGLVVLILNSRLEADRSVSRVEIVDASGRSLWVRDGSLDRGELGEFTVAVPVADLPAGKLRLQLWAEGSGGPEVVEVYQLVVG